MDDNSLTKGIVIPSYCPIYSPSIFSFRNAASFKEEDEGGSLRQVSVVHEHGEEVHSTDRVGHTDPSQTAKAQFPDCDYVNPVQRLDSTALPAFGKAHVPGPASITVRDIWQEYAHGLNGQEPLREKESRGTKWRQDPFDRKTGKRGHALRHFWCRRHPIYLFILMRIAIGDSEAVAVETCQEIFSNYPTRYGSP
jgi:hypothetical protein